MVLNVAIDSKLEAFIERIERIEEEKKTLADEVKVIMEEAKKEGFNAKAIRDVIRLRKMNHEEIVKYQDVVDTYLHKLGILK